MQPSALFPSTRSIAAILLLFFLILQPDTVDSLKIYKKRADVIRLLGNQNEKEEQLYLEFCAQTDTAADCEVAIDGEAATDWSQCASLTPIDQPNWTARLETPAYISRVVIHTIEQLPDLAMLNALADFVMIASDAVCYRHTSSAPFRKRSFPCDAFADVLILQSYRMNSILSLCEVEVFGKPVIFQGLDAGESEIGYQSCDQSSIDGDASCENAVDRNFVQFIGIDNKMCVITHAEQDYKSWWVGYFSVPALVRYVKLFNSLDKKYKSIMNNFVIKINDKQCAKFEDSRSYLTKIFSCAQFGSNIKVETALKQAALVLCQVQVFGYKIILLKDMNHKSMGCFKDTIEKPDFEMIAATAFMSPRKCHRICKRNNKLYFGLQNGQVCMCGNTYGRYGKAANGTECNLPCNDNDHAICGGKLHNSVYEIIF